MADNIRVSLRHQDDVETLFKKEIVIRIPVEVHKPCAKAGEKTLVDTNQNPGSSLLTKTEIKEIGDEIYDAGAKLLAAAQDHPGLLAEIILGHAHNELDLQHIFAKYSFDDALRKAIHKLPESSAKLFLQRGDGGKNLFLCDRVVAITNAIAFGETSVSIEDVPTRIACQESPAMAISTNSGEWFNQHE